MATLFHVPSLMHCSDAPPHPPTPRGHPATFPFLIIHAFQFYIFLLFCLLEFSLPLELGQILNNVPAKRQSAKKTLQVHQPPTLFWSPIIHSFCCLWENTPSLSPLNGIGSPSDILCGNSNDQLIVFVYRILCEKLILIFNFKLNIISI